MTAQGSPPPTIGTKLDPNAQSWIGKYELAAEWLGIEKFHDWQRDYLAGSSELEKDGTKRYHRSTLVLGRQGGKSECIPIVAMGDVAMGRHVCFTMQKKAKAKEKFRDWVNRWNDGAPAELRLKVRLQAGEEIAWIPGRGSLRIGTPDKDQVRGWTLDTIVIDEAVYVPAIFHNACRGAFATRPMWMMHKICTAGDLRDPMSRTFHDDVKAGREAALKPGQPTERFHMEYAADEHDDPKDRKVWAKVMPTIGCTDPQGVTWEFIESEYADFEKRGELDVFKREYLSIWTQPPVTVTLDPEAWSQLGDDQAAAGKRAVIAVDCGRERTMAAIAAATVTGKDPDTATVTVEIIAAAEGSSWVPGYLRKIRKANPGRIGEIVIDRMGPAGAFIPELQQSGFRCTRIGTSEMTDYWGVFMDRVTKGRLRHRPHPRLDQAVVLSEVRPVRDGFCWERRKDDAAAPLVAATIAVGHACARPKGAGIAVL